MKTMERMWEGLLKMKKMPFLLLNLASLGLIMNIKKAGQDPAEALLDPAEIVLDPAGGVSDPASGVSGFFSIFRR
jgi:hypothetical protein